MCVLPLCVLAMRPSSLSEKDVVPCELAHACVCISCKCILPAVYSDKYPFLFPQSIKMLMVAN